MSYANIRASVRPSYSILPSPPPLPFLLPSSLLSFLPLSYYLSSELFIQVQSLAFLFAGKVWGYRPVISLFINCIHLAGVIKKHTLSPLENLRGWQGHLLWPSRTLCSGNVASSSGFDSLPNFVLFEGKSDSRTVHETNSLP